jgi:twitching motility protein PilT
MNEPQKNFRTTLEEMVAMGASDLHLKVGQPPTLRIDGTLFQLDEPSCTAEDVDNLLGQILSPEQRAIFDRERELDLAVSVPGLARFRVNLCRQRNTMAVSFRLVLTRIPSLEELQLPAKLGELILEPRGLLLVTGATGVGKSTTLAAMVNHLNHLHSVKVVTIEDPIEYLHRDERCIIYQREVGDDTHSFHHGLRHILRQDPDVIMIGEIRDKETLSIALTAANTGHLVVSTLHTIDSVQSIQRMLSFFPPHEQDEVRRTLADNLVGIVSQRLLPKLGGQGRVPAVEILVNTPTAREYLLDPVKTSSIRTLIQDGVTQYGTQSFDQALFSLVHRGLVHEDDAIRFATSPNELKLHMQGIGGTSNLALSNAERTSEEEETHPGLPSWMEP